MIESYLSALARELERVGIRGSLERRILLETEDHLLSEPGALERFGAPELVAARFADELATTKTRGAAAATFAALAVAGAVFAVLFALAPRSGDVFAAGIGRTAAVLVAGALVVLAPQVAFVAGVLAAFRAFRFRREIAAPGGAVRLLRRQTSIALAAGWATVGSLAVFGAAKGGPEPRWWLASLLVGCSAAAAALVWPTVRLLRARALEPRVSGPAGDAYDDLDVLVHGHVDLRTRPWALCALTAVAAALATAAAAVFAGQPHEGIVNGCLEALAVVGGFWAFGESLGLRPSR
jgi:hypothetical protein